MNIVRADLNNPRDAEAIVDLLNSYATDLMGGSEQISQFCRDNLVKELLKRPNAHVFIVYYDDVPAAFRCFCLLYNSMSTYFLTHLHSSYSFFTYV